MCGLYMCLRGLDLTFQGPLYSWRWCSARLAGHPSPGREACPTHVLLVQSDALSPPSQNLQALFARFNKKELAADLYATWIYQCMQATRLPV